MKVKVILRAPKSQIPLYMTLNDAKFGNEEVATSLNVVESDEVIQWVNNTSTAPTTNFQISPQKRLEISEDLARSISSSLSEILKGRGIPQRSENRIKNLKSGSIDLSSVRHKYNVSQIKDVLPGKIMAELAERPKEESSSLKDKDDGTSQGISDEERSPEIERLEKMLSSDLEKTLSSSSSSMGASVGSKYNGKDLKSNLRKKYFRCLASSKGGKALYEYNKKFRSNDKFPELYPVFNDSGEEKETDHSLYQSSTEAIQEKIQREIDCASNMDSIQCEIVKTFNNLTLSPCLCKNSKPPSNLPYDRNQVIYQKRLFLNELHDKVPPKQSHYYVSPKNSSHNMYLLIHGSGEEPKDVPSPKNLSPGPASSSGSETPTREQHRDSAPPETLKAESPCDQEVQLIEEEDSIRNVQEPEKDPNPRSQLSQALSRLNLELSNANSIIDQCLKEKEEVVSAIDHVFVKDLQKKLDSLELLYRRVNINTDQDTSQNDQDERSVRLSGCRLQNDGETRGLSKSFENFGAEKPSTPGSNKVPDTNLPLLADDVSCRKKNLPDLVPRRLPFQKNILSYYETPQTLLSQSSSRLESKRSISVPAHERQLHDPQSRKSTKTIGEIPYLNEIQEQSGSRSLASIVSVGLNSSNLIINKPPQSKIGLKPNSSSERLSLELGERTRGRTRSQDVRHQRTNTRDFVAENKFNVALNASKSSSSLLQRNYSKKGTRLLKKKPSSVEKVQHSPISYEESHVRYDRNHNQMHHLSQYEFDHFGSRNEIYPSLEVGGPIARMNGTCGGFTQCLPGSCYNGYHYEQPNFRSFTGTNYNRAVYQHINNHFRTPYCQQQDYQRRDYQIGASGLGDNKTPRCPYWCNLIYKI